MIVYLDSSVWINRFEGVSIYQITVEDYLKKLSSVGWTVCASEAVLLEVLSKPYHRNQKNLIDLYYKAFSEIDIFANYDGLLRDALTVAQKENLRAMDSIHVAIALHYGCKKLVSTDRHFKDIQIVSTHWIDLSEVQ